MKFCMLPNNTEANAVISFLSNAKIETTKRFDDFDVSNHGEILQTRTNDVAFFI